MEAIRDRLSYMERRKERLVQKIGEKEFKNAVGEINAVLKRKNLDKSPTAREDLFEYINASYRQDKEKK